LSMKAEKASMRGTTTSGGIKCFGFEITKNFILFSFRFSVFMALPALTGKRQDLGAAERGRPLFTYCCDQ
jgi:hypothetical protein